MTTEVDCDAVIADFSADLSLNSEIVVSNLVLRALSNLLKFIACDPFRFLHFSTMLFLQPIPKRIVGCLTLATAL